MSKNIYNNFLWDEFVEKHKNDHYTPNNVLIAEYQKYYEENKHRLLKEIK